MQHTTQADLPQDNIIALAGARKEELQAMLDTLTKKLRKNTSGALRVQHHKKSFQYYIITTPGDTKGQYLPRKEIRKAGAIAQRDYNKGAAGVISKQIAALDRLLAEYRPNTLDETFTQLHPGRRALVTPVREPDADFVASWQHTPYTSKPFEINAPEYTTSTGVRVRSKSEVIIADALSRAGIPFRYEYPTSIKGWGTLYPDFTCLDIRTRKEIIWEHFGLMGDPDYTENAVQKIAHYATSGYTLGKNFIATFEANTSPLSIKQVQGYINTLFKSRSE